MDDHGPDLQVDGRAGRRLDVECTHVAGKVVVQPIGEIDLATSDHLKAVLLGLLEAGSRQLVLDLGAVEFVDSVGLGMLVGVRKGLGSDGELRLARCRPLVALSLRTTNLDTLFPMDDSVEEALAS
jgi:anti-sigma B factor antagonist